MYNFWQNSRQPRLMHANDGTACCATLKPLLSARKA
jgi:hypothetical protein